MNRDHQTIRAAITNEVIRAVAALRQQRTVAREQDGQTVFVPGTEAAREYLIETLDRAFGDSTSPATPVEPTCVACDKGDHRHCFGGVCACIHSRDWKRQDEEWSAGDDQPASHLPPAALPAVSGEGEVKRLVEAAEAFRAIALDALACWQVEDETPDDKQKRTRSAQSRTLLRHRLHSANGMLRASTPTPGAPR